MKNAKVLKYESPKVDIVFLQAQDVLTSSGGFCGDDHSLAPSGFSGEDDTLEWNLQ